MGIWIRSGAAWPVGSWSSLEGDVPAKIEIIKHAIHGSDVLQQMLAMGGLAAMTGLAAMVLFPRLATCLFWTLLGTSIMLVSGIAWAFYFTPERLERVPPSTTAQLVLLAGVMAFGMLCQWQGGRPASAPAKPAAPAGSPAVA